MSFQTRMNFFFTWNMKEDIWKNIVRLDVTFNLDENKAVRERITIVRTVQRSWITILKTVLRGFCLLNVFSS